MINHISVKGLKILRWLAFVYCLHFLVAYVYYAITLHNVFGSSAYILELAVVVFIQLVYELISLVIWHTRTPLQSAMITLTFAYVLTAIIMNTTGSWLSPYDIGMVVIIFAAGALGQAWSVGYFLAILFAYVLSIAGFFVLNGGGNIGGLIENGACLVSMGLSFVFWRQYYVVEGNPAIQQLGQMLRSRKQQTEIIMQSIADGVIVFDNNWKITLINKAAAEMAEWKVEDCIGIDIHLVVKLETEGGKELDKDDNPFKSALQLGKHINQILTLTGKDHKLTIVSLVVSPIILDDKETVGGVAVLRDFTQQRQEENKRADFISTASHEMRTPVAAIEGYLSLAMNEKVSNIDIKARDYLEKAHQSTRQLGKLFQDLLTSSRAEDGRLVSHPAVIEMGAFIQNLAESFALAAQKKHLLVDFTYEGEKNTGGGTVLTGKVIRPLYFVHVDPDRIQEVITNLFDNAVKYTESGKITIGIGGDNDFVHVSVKDTGLGIPADDIPHLFQKFYRVDNSAVRTIGGTGLGLFICRKIVELYNGKIWAESVIDKGSTFYIALPRLNTQQAEALKIAEEARNQLIA